MFRSSDSASEIVKATQDSASPPRIPLFPSCTLQRNSLYEIDSHLPGARQPLAQPLSLVVPPAAKQTSITRPTALPSLPVEFSEGANAPMSPPTAIRASMATGYSFPPEIAQKVDAVFGAPVRAGGLAEFFSPVLPQATWEIRNPEPDGTGVSFHITAVAKNGAIDFQTGWAIRRDTDGAIELHVFDLHVAPHRRGHGLTSHIEKRTTALLRAFSLNEQTRITAVAGFNNDPNTGRPQLGIGTYLHAVRGYLYADEAGVSSEYFIFSEPRSDMSERQRLASDFDAWVETEPTLQYRNRSLTLPERRPLRGLAGRCEQPFELAKLDISGLTALVEGADGRSTRTSLGKAFLLSGHASIWCAVRFINDAAQDSPPHIKALRLASKKQFEQHCSQPRPEFQQR
ncbi:MAG TPA: hypothetical protein VJQ51_10960 [Burkholderiales bacterium]|nr:hypothetical protein [Burkholderiales bacterium]